MNRDLLLALIEAFNDAQIPFRVLDSGAIALKKGLKLPDLYFRGLNEAPDEATLKCELGAFVTLLNKSNPDNLPYVCDVCRGVIVNCNLIASTWDNTAENIRYYHKWCDSAGKEERK